MPHGERAGQISSTITVDGAPLGTITYGDTALIRRMNVGLRRRKDKHLKGYLLDTLEGRWAKEADLAKNVEGQEPRIRPGHPLRRRPPQRHDGRTWTPSSARTSAWR